MLDAPGQPFFDRDADVALFETLESVIQPRAERQLMRIPHHINDPEFAQAIVEHFTAITDQTPIA
jgi:uncharacterized protein (UPF0261 family)